MKITLQQAAGNLPRKEFESIYNSLANPAASCGECARFCGSSADIRKKATVSLSCEDEQQHKLQRLLEKFEEKAKKLGIDFKAEINNK